MRVCPVCESSERETLFLQTLCPPDDWGLPHEISWHKCVCGMLYGDGDFNQEGLDRFYKCFYGFGVNLPSTAGRLQGMADEICEKYPRTTRVVDFGGSGDDGKSIMVERLKSNGFSNAYNVNVGEDVPRCNIILASHVIEHIYDVQGVMDKINNALFDNGLLIVEGPSTTGMLLECDAPMLDFNAKHINHFRLIDYLRLMSKWGFELIESRQYTEVRSDQTYPAYKMYFKHLDVAHESIGLIKSNLQKKIDKINSISEPVNVWGLGDLAFCLLSYAKQLNVIQYVDSDPAMRGATINGQSIDCMVRNDAPIVIMVQGQRNGLLGYIKSTGITNKLIEV